MYKQILYSLQKKMGDPQSKSIIEKLIQTVAQ